MADMLQEVADQPLMLAAQVLLECCLHPVFYVAHLDPAGMPAYIEVPQ